MKTKTCPCCGAEMKRNGKTSAGTQRWRCRCCGSSYTHKRYDPSKELQEFLSWLFSKQSQLDMPGQGRSFRRRTQKFWQIWPVPDVVDEIHRTIYVDGIYLARNIVVLIACSDSYVLSWYLARCESSASWQALLSRIAPPEMVLSDGGSGFAKALRQCWPETFHQRCLFHVFCQVKRCTATHPKLLAGKELYQIAKQLLSIHTIKEAECWVEHFVGWCEFWSDFLAEKSCIDGRMCYTHERLRKARSILITLINKKTLFTYLDPKLCIDEAMPCTTNRIEGAINAQLRALLRNHRGMSVIRRIKAVHWWCYMHTECPLSAKEILEQMPTDKDIDLLKERYAINLNNSDGPDRCVYVAYAGD